MSMFAITDHIDENIRIELQPVAGCDRGAFHHGFRNIPVDMQYRGVDGGCQGGTVIGAARVVEVGREADLVVDDKVHGATGVIAFQVAHLQYFVNDTLTRYGGIPMDE